MKARTMTLMAATMACMMSTMAAAQTPMTMPMEDAAQSMSRKAQMRTVMQYGTSAWLAPAAVVLTSAADWSNWNREMVESGKAVGEEPAPQVDWTREAVLVVTMGVNLNEDLSVELREARRAGRRTMVTMEVTRGQGGSSPCHVVAMDRSMLQLVDLACNLTVAGLPTSLGPYGTLQPADGPPATQLLSWGALKADYR